jgi:hypothetical protein
MGEAKPCGSKVYLLTSILNSNIFIYAVVQMFEKLRVRALNEQLEIKY